MDESQHLRLGLGQRREAALEKSAGTVLAGAKILLRGNIRAHRWFWHIGTSGGDDTMIYAPPGKQDEARLSRGNRVVILPDGTETRTR